MWLSLTDDDGVVLERWYLHPNDITPAHAATVVSDHLPVYDSKEEAEADQID